MLTIQNNLKTTNLETLSKRLIKDDYHNFKLSVVGGGFTEDIADCIISKLTSNKDAKIIVINDITLQMICKLLEAGYKLENITLAFGKWNSNGTVLKDKAVYTIMNSFIKANVKEAIKTINLEELFMGVIKTDTIISNPPYGKIGAKITENVINNIAFDTYINLEPVVDFLKFPNIYNHIKLDETEIVEGFGEDAHVLPSIFTFDKSINNNLTVEEFFVYTVSNDLTNKYFFENIINRKTYNSIAFDEDTTVRELDFSKRLIFGIKVCSNAANHLDKAGINVGGTCKSTPYKINKQELTLDAYYQAKRSKAFWGVILTFNSDVERMNAFNFSYSKDGFRFLNLLAHSMQRDNFHAKEYMALFPKVDWTRPWTVEEILTDYGYTETEIADVMADLNNFKGMED